MPTLVEPTMWRVPQEATASGCFETMRAYRGQIFRLEDHLDRLAASAATLSVTLPPKHRLAQQLRSALKRSRLKEAVVRVALLPDAKRLATPSIVVRSAIRPPAVAYRRGVHVVVVPTRASSMSAVNPQAKYSARLGSIFAVTEAQLRGADEALFMDAMGLVTESTASNFGLVFHGEVMTPPCWLGLLAGITRDVLVELCGALRLMLRETPLTRHELYNAEEAFLTSTLKEVLPVTKIDGRIIGTGRPGPITRRLHRAFGELVHRELRASS